MNVKIHHIKGIDIGEATAEGKLINSTDEGLDFLGTIYFQGIDKIILHQHQLFEEFFDLSTGAAGEILQKFSNYRVRLAVVGNFKDVKSKSLNDFIRESNRLGQINFCESLDDALEKLVV